MKHILTIVGSASSNSNNHKLADLIANRMQANFSVTQFDDLKKLPHFDPDLSVNNPPNEIIALRTSIEQAHGILIITPEYVFSIPSGLKNVIEWCIASTVFSDKPLGLITASTSGYQAHEELQLIMKTAAAKFSAETTLLISGIKTKFDSQGQIPANSLLDEQINDFISAFENLVNSADFENAC